MDVNRNSITQAWSHLRRWARTVLANPVFQAEVLNAVVSLSLAPIVGPDATFAIGVFTELGWLNVSRDFLDGPQQAYIMPTSDNQVTPGFIVYTTDVSPPARGASESPPPTITIDRHWFHDEALAIKYVDLVVKPALVDRHYGDTEEDRIALDKWAEATREAGPDELLVHLQPAYFHSPAPSPGAGVILWRPVFTQYNVSIAVVSDNDMNSVSKPPTVFPDLRSARASVAQASVHSKIGPWRPLPPELARQLHPAPVLDGDPPTVGSQVYRRTPPSTVQIRASRPEPIGVPRPASGTDGRRFGASWYVSPHPRGAFAWRPAGSGRLELLMTPSPKDPGAWRVQRWRDVHAALQNLGQVGVWAQRAPEFDPSPPSLAARRALLSSPVPSLQTRKHTPPSCGRAGLFYQMGRKTPGFSRGRMSKGDFLVANQSRLATGQQEGSRLSSPGNVRPRHPDDPPFLVQAVVVVQHSECTACRGQLLHFLPSLRR